MTGRFVFALGLLTAVLGRATRGLAQSDGRARAVELVTESMQLYERGEFQRALDLLHQAYAFEKDPVIFYNMARAHERLGDLAAAIDAYRAYVTELPSAPDRT